MWSGTCARVLQKHFASLNQQLTAFSEVEQDDEKEMEKDKEKKTKKKDKVKESEDPQKTNKTTKQERKSNINVQFIITYCINTLCIIIYVSMCIKL